MVLLIIADSEIRDLVAAIGFVTDIFLNRKRCSFQEFDIAPLQETYS